MSEVPQPVSPRGSKMVVAGLLVIMAIGTVIWVYLEWNAEVLLNREKGGRFGADYEKRCQASFEPSVCKKLAGLHHSTCMRNAGLDSPDEAVELQVYLTCMLAKQAEASP